MAGGCFAAGTLVHTRDGLKRIEEVEAGEFVLAQPEFQGERGWRRVKEVFRRAPQDMVAVEIVSPAKCEIILATLEHPFWVKDKGWTGAKDLTMGQSLELADGGEARIAGVTQVVERQPVFNFAVDGFHTYYVGELGVWVHNASFVGAIWNGQAGSAKLIGSYTPSANLTFGTTLFGDEAHAVIASRLRTMNSGVAFDMRIGAGQRGIDVTVIGQSNIGKLGFEFAEIKPLTLSGERTLLRQT